MVRLGNGQFFMDCETLNAISCISYYCYQTHGGKCKDSSVEELAPSIGSRVFIGNGAKIIGDVKVGDDVFIAHGSVVVKDIPAGSVVVGNPSRVISQRGAEYVSKYLHWK